MSLGSYNVRCVGDGHWAAEKSYATGIWRVQRISDVYTEPCGWHGLRVGAATGTWPGTIKPCPHCHGRVEMIPVAEATEAGR